MCKKYVKQLLSAVAVGNTPQSRLRVVSVFFLASLILLSGCKEPTPNYYGAGEYFDSTSEELDVKSLWPFYEEDPVEKDQIGLPMWVQKHGSYWNSTGVRVFPQDEVRIYVRGEVNLCEMNPEQVNLLETQNGQTQLAVEPNDIGKLNDLEYYSGYGTGVRSYSFSSSRGPIAGANLSLNTVASPIYQLSTGSLYGFEPVTGKSKADAMYVRENEIIYLDVFGDVNLSDSGNRKCVPGQYNTQNKPVASADPDNCFRFGKQMDVVFKGEGKEERIPLYQLGSVMPGIQSRVYKGQAHYSGLYQFKAPFRGVLSLEYRDAVVEDIPAKTGYSVNIWTMGCPESAGEHLVFRVSNNESSLSDTKELVKPNDIDKFFRYSDIGVQKLPNGWNAPKEGYLEVGIADVEDDGHPVVTTTGSQAGGGTFDWMSPSEYEIAGAQNAGNMYNATDVYDNFEEKSPAKNNTGNYTVTIVQKSKIKSEFGEGVVTHVIQPIMWRLYGPSLKEIDEYNDRITESSRKQLEELESQAEDVRELISKVNFEIGKLGNDSLDAQKKVYLEAAIQGYQEYIEQLEKKIAAKNDYIAMLSSGGEFTAKSDMVAEASRMNAEVDKLDAEIRDLQAQLASATTEQERLDLTTQITTAQDNSKELQQYVASMQDTRIGGVITYIFKEMLATDTLRGIIYLTLQLYIIFFGIGFLIGVIQLNKFDVVIRVFKLSIIAVLLSDTSWEFFTEHFFRIFVDGSLDIIDMVSGQMQASGESARKLTFLDNIFQSIFSEVAMYKMSSMIFVPPFIFGIIIFLFIWIGILLLVVAIFQAILVYLVSIIAIGFLIMLAPIFIPMILFKPTRAMFDSWVKHLVSYFIQPILVFALIAVFSEIIIQLYYSVLYFPICWGGVYDTELETVKDVKVTFKYWYPCNVGHYVSVVPPVKLMALFAFLIIANMILYFISFITSAAEHITGTFSTSLAGPGGIASQFGDMIGFNRIKGAANKMTAAATKLTGKMGLKATRGGIKGAWVLAGKPTMSGSLTKGYKIEMKGSGLVGVGKSMGVALVESAANFSKNMGISLYIERRKLQQERDKLGKNGVRMFSSDWEKMEELNERIRDIDKKIEELPGLRKASMESAWQDAKSGAANVARGSALLTKRLAEKASFEGRRRVLEGWELAKADLNENWVSYMFLQKVPFKGMLDNTLGVAEGDEGNAKRRAEWRKEKMAGIRPEVKERVLESDAKKWYKEARKGTKESRHYTGNKV